MGTKSMLLINVPLLWCFKSLLLMSSMFVFFNSVPPLWCLEWLILTSGTFVLLINVPHLWCFEWLFWWVECLCCWSVCLFYGVLNDCFWWAERLCCWSMWLFSLECQPLVHNGRVSFVLLFIWRGLPEILLSGVLLLSLWLQEYMLLLPAFLLRTTALLMDCM
jgi:hypothetical protein